MGISLGDRLRGIVNIPAVDPDALRSSRAFDRPVLDLERTADILGGAIVKHAEGVVVVVDRHYAVGRSHGRVRIGDIVDTLRAGSEALDILQRAWPSRNTPTCSADLQVRANTPRLLFLDLETTGLAGGAGTQAFLVGCLVIEGDELLVRQFLLPGFEHERALLAEAGAWAARQGTLVTFNGRSFDVPLIETRYAFHRLAFPFQDAPHIDMLHASRRLWKERPSVAGPPLDDDSCKLSVLERHLAGVHRIGDVPGFEMPSRFFRFVRDGNAFPLEAVLEHNRIDLVSLALVTAHAIRLIEQGPSATTHPRECLGLGRLYERVRMTDHADACYAQAADMSSRLSREIDVRGEALRRLALSRRRAGRMAEAASAWAQIVTLPGCPSALRREAREALAVHHEHRSRDLQTAKMFVLDGLAENPAPRWRSKAEYRLQRLESKLAKRRLPRLMDYF
jgi:uncharacterized protein YprB with RNaseH-like and TPR domain